MPKRPTGPLDQLKRLKEQKAALEAKITDAERKHIHSLGLLFRETGTDTLDRTFLKGVLIEAKKVPKTSDRYKELAALGARGST